ncbi:MAG: hypothetical protein IJS50_01850, partial [Desulfovibrio sp.]|nr:hypothetical protein [Desulfovibrio sp.]
LTELDRITDATSSTVLRANLAQLRKMVAQRSKAQELQRLDFVENTVRSTLYQAETIRSFAFRYLQVCKLLKTEGQGALLASQKKKVQQTLDNYYEVLLTSANQYKSQLRRLLRTEVSVLEPILAHLRSEYAGEDTLARHLEQNLQTLEAHLAEARRHGLEQLRNVRLCLDIIPKQHTEQMPHFKR